MTAADCCWLKKMAQILRSCVCVFQVILSVATVTPEREIDRRVLTADIDTELGLKTCVLSGFGHRDRLSTQQRSCACLDPGSDQRRRRRDQCRGSYSRSMRCQGRQSVTWCKYEILFFEHISPLKSSNLGSSCSQTHHAFGKVSLTLSKV